MIEKKRGEPGHEPGWLLCKRGIEQCLIKKDATPDLTWKTGNMKTDRKVEADPWGSDHMPITITLHLYRVRGVAEKFSKWVDFRVA